MELGTPLRHIIQEFADVSSSVSAVLVGGYFGTWVGVSALDSPLSEAGLRRAGARPGARAMVVLGTRGCGVVETARVLRYLADESAGQCGPCTFGLRAMADAALSLARREAQPPVIERLRVLAGLVEGRGACAHPDGATNLLKSALSLFADEVELHLRGHCSALVA